MKRGGFVPDGLAEGTMPARRWGAMEFGRAIAHELTETGEQYAEYRAIIFDATAHYVDGTDFSRFIDGIQEITHG